MIKANTIAMCVPAQLYYMYPHIVDVNALGTNHTDTLDTISSSRLVLAQLPFQQLFACLLLILRLTKQFELPL